MGSGPVWTGAENLAPTEIRSPDRQVTIPTAQSWPATCMAVDFIIVQPKYVAAVGFAVINGVCQRTASLLLRALQAKWGCHTLRLLLVCDTGRLRNM